MRRGQRVGITWRASGKSGRVGCPAVRWKPRVGGPGWGLRSRLFSFCQAQTVAPGPFLGDTGAILAKHRSRKPQRGVSSPSWRLGVCDHGAGSTLCVCLCPVASSYQDIGRVGSRRTVTTSFHTDFLLRGPLSKHSRILGCWGWSCSLCLWGTIQSPNKGRSCLEALCPAASGAWLCPCWMHRIRPAVRWLV